MSILEPSTTATTRQVWPRLPKPGEAPKPATKPRAEREPVTLDEIEVGDELSFLIDEDHRYKGEYVGEVVKVNEARGVRVLVLVQTDRGKCVLTRRNWERRAPRR